MCPLPVRQSNLGRFFDIFVEMPLHVFIGVILMMAPRALTDTFAQPPARWNVDPVADQAVAGALAWSYGEPVALLTTLIFAIRWRRDEERESAQREADPARDDDFVDARPELPPRHNLDVRPHLERHGRDAADADVGPFGIVFLGELEDDDQLQGYCGADSPCCEPRHDELRGHVWAHSVPTSLPVIPTATWPCLPRTPPGTP